MSGNKKLVRKSMPTILTSEVCSTKTQYRQSILYMYCHYVKSPTRVRLVLVKKATSQNRLHPGDVKRSRGPRPWQQSNYAFASEAALGSFREGKHSINLVPPLMGPVKQSFSSFVLPHRKVPETKLEMDSSYRIVLPVGLQVIRL